MSFQSFVLLHLVIALVRNTKKLQFSRNKSMKMWLPIRWKQFRSVSCCGGNHCWFCFVLCCGYCSLSFQSFVLRHLVMAPVSISKKLLFSRNKSMKKKQNYLAQYQVISNDHAYVLIRWGLFWNNKSCFSITHRQWWSSNQLGKPSFCYLQYLFASFHWGEHFKNKEAEIVTVHNEQNHFNTAYVNRPHLFGVII